MRFTRIITAMVAVFTAVMLGLTTGGTAQAVGGDVTAKAAAKPQHVVKYLQSGETRRDGIFYVKGRLTQAKGHVVYLQARTAARPAWRTVTADRSARDNGSFGITFRGKCGAAYQIVIRESPSFARTEIRIGKVRCY